TPTAPATWSRSAASATPSRNHTRGDTVTETATAGAQGVRWNLADLFAGADDPRWTAELEGALADAKAFEARYRGTVNVAGGPAADHLRGALEAFEAIHTRSALAQSFARLLYAADASSA